MSESREVAPKKPLFKLNFSRQFDAWLAGSNASIAFSTYQAGKVFLVGMGEQRINIAERTFARCKGLAAHNDRMYLASLYQLWRFNNVLGPGEDYQGQDRLFIPHVGYTTGDVDAHDIGIDGQGNPVFVNTPFSCLARPSAASNFEVVWRPRSFRSWRRRVAAI